jgi:hypothetical protein
MKPFLFFLLFSFPVAGLAQSFSLIEREPGGAYLLILKCQK